MMDSVWVGTAVHGRGRADRFLTLFGCVLYFRA